MRHLFWIIPTLLTQLLSWGAWAQRDCPAALEPKGYDAYEKTYLQKLEELRQELGLTEGAYITVLGQDWLHESPFGPDRGMRGLVRAALERVGVGFAQEKMVPADQAHEKVFRGFDETLDRSEHVIAYHESEMRTTRWRQTLIGDLDWVDPAKIASLIGGYGRITGRYRTVKDAHGGLIRLSGKLPVQFDALHPEDLEEFFGDDRNVVEIGRVWLDRIAQLDRQSFYISVIEQALAFGKEETNTRIIVTALGPRARLWESWGFKKVKLIAIHHSSQPTWLMEASPADLRKNVNRRTERAIQDHLAALDRNLGKPSLMALPVPPHVPRDPVPISVISINTAMGAFVLFSNPHFYNGHLSARLIPHDGIETQYLDLASETHDVGGYYELLPGAYQSSPEGPTFDVVRIRLIANFMNSMFEMIAHFPVFSGTVTVSRHFVPAGASQNLQSDQDRYWFNLEPRTAPSFYGSEERHGRHLVEYFEYPVSDKAIALESISDEQGLNVRDFRKKFPDQIKVNGNELETGPYSEGVHGLIFYPTPHPAWVPVLNWEARTNRPGDRSLGSHPPLSPLRALRMLRDLFESQPSWRSVLDSLGLSPRSK